MITKIKTKKRILIVTQNFFPETFGINDIVSEMVKKGVDVDVLTGLPNYPQGKFYKGYGLFQRGPKYYHGARLYRCAVFPRLKNSNLGICLNYASFPFFATLKALLVCFKKYDEIFVYQPSPLFVAIPAKIISFFTKTRKTLYILDIWPESVYSVINFKNNMIRKMLKSYSVKTYRSFDRLLITSRGFKEELIKVGIEDKKIIYFPQWAPEYSDDSSRAQIDKSKYCNTFNVLFAGNIGVPQNLGVLVKTALLLGDYKEHLRFVIVGDGDFYDELVRLVEKSQVEDMFIFVGRVPFSHVNDYYDIADCLFASLKDVDLFSKIIPAKIQSYMMAKKPILCAINGESANIISEAECGLCSASNDEEALTQNIIQFYGMPKQERIKMGENGYSYAKEHFNREILLNALYKMFMDE